MNPDRWQQVKAALQEAMSLDPSERARYLERIGASDPDLRGEVASLLAADEDAGSGFMCTPLVAARGLPPLHGTLIGRRLGPYELTAQIGIGGMGEVYEAIRVDDEYRQHVAIKLVHSGLLPSFVAHRLRAERQILANLNHPNIARLLDGGTTDEGIPYLVMELIAGQPITEYCEQRRLDITERLQLFLQVCAAVQYAHQHLVIHRDLKPSNVLVTHDGVPKLLDFGIAKILDPGSGPAATDLTIATLGILTPQYASPEQLKSEPVTTASDVYSLGVLLYELLTGVRPYSDNQTHNDLRRAVLESEPRRPSTVVRRGGSRIAPASAHSAAGEPGSTSSEDKLHNRLRGDLDNIVLLALAKDPQRRYGTVDHLAEDIQRHLQHRPVLARKPTLGYLIATFVTRHTTVVAASVAIALALIGGIFATAREARIAEAQRQRAERRFSEIRSLANSLIFDIHDSISTLPRTAPSRKLLVGTALRYLDSLSKESSGDESLQLEMAAAYMRLGDTEGNFEASQDNYAEALTSYRRGTALLEAVIAATPTNTKARRSAALLYNKLSDLLWTTGDGSGSLSFAQRALETNRLVAALDPADPDTEIWNAGYEMDYGYKVFRIGNDPTEALRYLKFATTRLQQLGGAAHDIARLHRTLILVFYHMAEVRLGEHNFAEALAMSRKSLEAAATARAAAPDDPDLRVLESAGAHFAAEALLGLGQPEEAARYEHSTLTTVRALAEADPNIAEFKGFVAMALTGMAEITLRQGQTTHSITLLEEAMRVSDAALSAGTMHPYVRNSKGRTESLLGAAYAALASNELRGRTRRLQDWKTARDWYQRAATSFGQISPIWVQAAMDARRMTEEIARCDRMLTQLGVKPRATARDAATRGRVSIPA